MPSVAVGRWLLVKIDRSTAARSTARRRARWEVGHNPRSDRLVLNAAGPARNHQCAQIAGEAA
ncbi:MAG: hypothetical protein QOI89_3656 [Solirubrobacteraceae bacterium]|jgi:hypothetical protein|nr:hypothetical protein [Solirubrobacteraceae bacterium]